MSVSQLTGIELVIFFCSSFPVVSFDTPRVSKSLYTLVLLSLHLCVIIGFICDLFVARSDIWMS